MKNIHALCLSILVMTMAVFGVSYNLFCQSSSQDNPLAAVLFALYGAACWGFFIGLLTELYMYLAHQPKKESPL